MTFTKRERWIGNLAGWTAMGLLVAVLLGLASGCTSQATTVTERTEELTGYVAAMEDAGLKGRAFVIWGTGHAGGQAFNISGSSGFIEVSFGGEPE